MKRVIKSAYDPYGAAIAEAQGLTVEQYQTVSKIAAIFMHSSRTNLPQVEMELISFRYNADDNMLTYYGDMAYNGDNRMLTIAVPVSDGVEHINMKDIIIAYVSEVANAYGTEVIEEAGLSGLL